MDTYPIGVAEVSSMRVTFMGDLYMPVAILSAQVTALYVAPAPRSRQLVPYREGDIEEY